MRRFKIATPSVNDLPGSSTSAREQVKAASFRTNALSKVERGQLQFDPAVENNTGSSASACWHANAASSTKTRVSKSAKPNPDADDNLGSSTSARGQVKTVSSTMAKQAALATLSHVPLAPAFEQPMTQQVCPQIELQPLRQLAKAARERSSNAREARANVAITRRTSRSTSSTKDTTRASLRAMFAQVESELNNALDEFNADYAAMEQNLLRMEEIIPPSHPIVPAHGERAAVTLLRNSPRFSEIEITEPGFVTTSHDDESRGSWKLRANFPRDMETSCAYEFPRGNSREVSLQFCQCLTSVSPLSFDSRCDKLETNFSGLLNKPEMGVSVWGGKPVNSGTSVSVWQAKPANCDVSLRHQNLPVGSPSSRDQDFPPLPIDQKSTSSAAGELKVVIVALESSKADDDPAIATLLPTNQPTMPRNTRHGVYPTPDGVKKGGAKGGVPAAANKANAGDGTPHAPNNLQPDGGRLRPPVE